MHKRQMFLDLSFVDDLNDLELVEMLLTLFDERNLAFEVAFCLIRVKELVLVVVNDWGLALQEDLVEPLPVVGGVVVVCLVYLEP